MNNISLSYIVATRNRLPFLKINLEKLIAELQGNEEIVVVDGNSTDGSQAYLQKLFDTGKIHRYISEPDQNQAHGWNKAMLMARGDIIKKIIDDDIYHFESIRKCRDFMLAVPHIDVCISNHLESHLTQPERLSVTGRLAHYRDWQTGKISSFTFSDVTLLIRKSSISYLGLYDTQFKMMDWEYALRLSYLKATIVYYTGYNALSVATPGNVTSSANIGLLKYEEAIGKLKYDYAGDNAAISRFSRFKIWLGKKRDRLTKQHTSTEIANMPDESELQKIYASFYQALDEYNKKGTFNFIK